jgi:hypothetical protein
MGVSRGVSWTTVKDLIMRKYGRMGIVLMGLGYSAYGSAWHSVAAN